MSYHSHDDNKPFGIVAIVAMAVLCVVTAVALAAGVYKLMEMIL